MNSQEAQIQLQNLLQKWSTEVFPKQAGLVGALQFGSTLKSPLKRETDLDLFLIFQDLPKSRLEQFNLTNDLEILINKDLKMLTDFNIQVSLILKSVSQSVSQSVSWIIFHHFILILSILLRFGLTLRDISVCFLITLKNG